MQTKYEVLTPSGWSDFSGVKITHRADGIKLRLTSTNDGESFYLDCTPEHLIRHNGTFIKAIDSIWLSIDTENGSCVVSEIVMVNESLPYFDILNVEKNHEYYTSGVVSHNCAFIDKWKEFADSVLPTVSSDPNANIIITSTPNGMNHYYDAVKSAREGTSEYFVQEVPWNCLPERDEEWKDNIIKTHGLIYFNQNYGCQFVGSSQTLLEPSTLDKLQSRTPLDESTSVFTIYQKPRKDVKYIVLCDIASGTGGDYTVAHVIKILKNSFEQVAMFRSNTTPVIQLPQIFIQIAQQYNNAYMLFELNYGAEVPSRIYNDYEYENLLTVSRAHRQQTLLGFGGTFQLGLYVDSKTKEMELIGVKNLLDSGKLVLSDHETISELYTFIQKPNGSFSAENGSHDDCVMSLALLGWLVTQAEFKEITEYDFVSDYEEHKAEELEALLPPSFFCDNPDFDDGFIPL